VAEGDSVAVPGHAEGIEDGEYIVGVRPHHVATRRRSTADIRISAQVELAEIGGSETSIHLEHGGARWISLQQGIHRIDTGVRIDVYVDPGTIFIFQREGELVAAPKGAANGESRSVSPP
jgi:glycerol transport system ATP-binding protein